MVRPPGKTGFLKMTASKRTCNSARLRDVKGGHSRDEDKTAAFAAIKPVMNRVCLWAGEVHLPSFCVRRSVSKMSTEVGFASILVGPWDSDSPVALDSKAYVYLYLTREVRAIFSSVK